MATGPRDEFPNGYVGGLAPNLGAACRIRISGLDER